MQENMPHTNQEMKKKRHIADLFPEKHIVVGLITLGLLIILLPLNSYLTAQGWGSIPAVESEGLVVNVSLVPPAVLLGLIFVLVAAWMWKRVIERGV